MPVTVFRTAAERGRIALRKSAILIVNSGALAVGTLSTAVLGFVYWWLAARTFAPEAIGRASALLSMMGLIGLLGDGGLGTLLIGELQRHRDRGKGLVSAALGAGFLLVLAMSLLFVAVESYFADGVNLIDGWPELALFVAGCCLTSATGLGNQAQLGNLRATGRMTQQILFAALKLALIGVAVAAGGVSDDAILLSWVGAGVLSWIVFDLASRGSARMLVGRPDFALLGTLRRKVFDHWALDVSMMSPGVIMPYLVLVLLSPTTNAAFACLWMLVSMAAIVPAVLATALFPVAVADPGQARHNILMSLSASFAFSVVCALVVFLFSRDLLALFNPAYPAIAGDGLGLLGFGLLGLTLKFHICALARLGGWMRRASLWFAFGAALEFASVAAGARFGGLSGLVLGWVVAVSAEGGLALVVLLVAVRGSRPTVMGPPDAIPMARREVGSASPASPSEVTASALSLPDPGDTLHEHRRHDQRNFAAPTSRCLHSLAPWRLNRVRW